MFLLLLSGGSSTRAYKVAGFTLLACALIAGQAITAYFLLSQRGEIRSLEEQNKNQEVMMTRGGSGEKAKFSPDKEEYTVHC